MRRIVSSLTCIALCFLVWSSMALAAEQRVLVLPFVVNAPAASTQLAADIPSLVCQSLERFGLKAIPTSAPRNAQPENTSSAIAKAMRTQAQYAVYGSFNQIGEGFDIEMQMVQAATKASRSFHLEGSSLLELQPVVNSLVGQVVGEISSRDIVSGDPSRPVVKGANGIADIQVHGLHFIDPDRVLMRVSTSVGDPFDADNIDRDVRSIWDLGYFNDVSAEVVPGMGGQILIFNVVEKPRIEDMRVEGSDAVSIGDITEAMSTHTGSVLNQKVLADDLHKVTELYHQKGFYLADVTYEVETNSDGSSAVLILHVDEGNKLYIKEVAIEGLQELKPDDIKGYLSLKERGMFSWITGTGVLKEDLLERDQQAIRAYFMKHGYVEGQVAAPEVLYEDDGIRVIFRAREGIRYKVGEVTLSGDLIDTEARIMEEITMDDHHAAGDFFDVEVLQDDVKSLTEFYSDYGYAFADIDVRPQPRPDEGVVDVVYMIKPGEKQYVRRVEVEGNTRTRDNVILREMRLADGQQFSGAKMRRSAERLEKTRYFSEVNPKVVPTGVPGEVDLKMGVKETETGVVSLGFGYSTYDKFGISASISENNLFGRGYVLGVSGYTADSEQYVEAQFINPRVFDSYWGFSVNPYGTEEEWSYFYKRSVGGSFRVFHPLGEYTNFSVGYKLERYNLYHMSENAARIIQAYKGKHWASVLSMSVTRDTTNKSMFATRGTHVRLSMQYADSWLGGDDRFFKPVLEAGFYYGLNDSNIIHVRGTIGAVYKTENDKVVPVFERFWIGGIRSIRGYSYDDISPRDTVTGETIGSDRMGYANFEYIWVVKPDIGLAFVPFYDIGFNADSEQTSNVFDKIYASAGLEVRWRSPMGDLRFAYGYPLSKNSDGEKRHSGRFEFSMGQSF